MNCAKMKLFKPKIQVFSLVRSKIDFEERKNEIFVEKTSRSKDKNQHKNQPNLLQQIRLLEALKSCFRSREKFYFLQQRFTTCNNLICCKTGLTRGCCKISLFTGLEVIFLVHLQSFASFVRFFSTCKLVRPQANYFPLFGRHG